MAARNFIQEAKAGETFRFPNGRYFYIKQADEPIDIATEGNNGAPVRFEGVSTGAKFGPVEPGQGWQFLRITSATDQHIEMILSDDGLFEMSNTVTVAGTVQTEVIGVPLPVKIEGIDSTNPLTVKIEGIDSTNPLTVKIDGIDDTNPLPIKISESEEIDVRAIAERANGKVLSVSTVTVDAALASQAYTSNPSAKSITVGVYSNQSGSIEVGKTAGGRGVEIQPGMSFTFTATGGITSGSLFLSNRAETNPSRNTVLIWVVEEGIQL